MIALAIAIFFTAAASFAAYVIAISVRTHAPDVADVFDRYYRLKADAELLLDMPEPEPVIAAMRKPARNWRDYSSRQTVGAWITAARQPSPALAA